jgi:histidine triad (HIT) family protein
MSCLFCEIAAGTQAAEIVYEDTQSVAFLDHRPLFPGHVLLIPRRHMVTLADLPAAEVGAFFRIAQRLETAIERAMEADGSFIAINSIVSQSVLHLHVHIVPRRRKDGLKGFFWPRARYRDDAHRQETAEKIRAALRDAAL